MKVKPAIFFLKYLLAALFLSSLMWFSIAPSPVAETAQDISKPAKDTIMEYTLSLPRLPLEEKSRIMVKSSHLKHYFRVDEKGVFMYASGWHKKKNLPECTIYTEEIPRFLALAHQLSREDLLKVYMQKGTKSLDSLPLAASADLAQSPTFPLFASPSKPLQGVKVALDPGHLGGSMDMAILEGKFMRMRGPDGNIKEFNEGNINLETAKLLAEKLENLGAKVMLTRSQKGHSAFQKDFPTWIKEDLKSEVKKAIAKQELSWPDADFLLRRANHRQIFHRFFKHLDFKERARKINAFQPHLTIVIHYNVDETNYLTVKSDRTMGACKTNYSMAFIGGAFMAQELGTPSERLSFMRLLLSEDIASSASLAGAVTQHYRDLLGVPHADSEKVKYLSVNSIPVKAPGVFARNLALTRLINGPICYGESFYQDNAQEFARLTDDQNPSQRLGEVADAYLKGVLDFVDSHRVPLNMSANR